MQCKHIKHKESQPSFICITILFGEIGKNNSNSVS